MSAQEVVFILVGIATGGAAILTVTSKNLVHAALYLAVTLSGIAAEFLILHADFVAMVQLIVYVGAIAVLFMFGLMLTRAPIGREALDSQNRGLAAVVSVALFGVLASLVVQAFRNFSETGLGQLPDGPNTLALGEAIFSTWVLPFELISMLLLGALIGSILLSRREEGESGEIEPSRRIEMGDEPSAETEYAELPTDTDRTPAMTSGGDA